MKRKFLKIVIFVITCLLLCSLLSIKVYATSNVQNDTVAIYDLAKILSSSEEQTLLKKAQAYATYNKLNLVFVITNSTNGKSAMQYADEFYNGYNPDKIEFADDGILFLLTTNNDCYISTSGTAITYLTDREIDWTLDKLSKSQAYITRFYTMLEGTMRYFEDNTDNYATEEKPRSVGGGVQAAAIALAISLLIDLPVFAIGKRKRVALHNQLNQNPDYNRYTGKNGLTIISSTEKLVDTSQYIRRGVYAASTGYGGSSRSSSFHGGSSHTSHTRSGGSRSHGGGGRRL